MKSKYYICLLLIIFLFGIGFASSFDYYVGTNGSDDQSGNKSFPFRTIQKALNIAQSGDTIYLMPGEYKENIKTLRDGKYDKPIVIKGNGNVVLKGQSNDDKILEINHDYIHVEGFTIDGLMKEGDSKDDYVDKLIFVQGIDSEGVRGIKIYNMKFRNSGGEAVRLRYFVRESEVAYSTFENIGVYDFKFNGGGKNGEGIYIGTSSNQWEDGKNPTSEPDVSANNWVHHNYFNTQGNECVDIKEGSVNNTIEYNVCLGQKDENSGGFDSRGDWNTFRYNLIFENEGAGIRFGGHESKNQSYGKHNSAYGNLMIDNNGEAIRIEDRPQARININLIWKDLFFQV